jgi:predicted ATPase
MAQVRVLQPNPFAIELQSKRDQGFLARNGSNFAAFYDHLNDERPDVRTELERRLGLAIPGFKNFRFQRIGDGKLLLASFDGEPGSAEFNLGQLSEGQRILAILYSATAALLSGGAVLCFDEPDNFVSLPEIQLWLQTVRDCIEAAQDHEAQVIIVSHHPEVIDYLALDSIWRFERPAGAVVARPLEVDDASELKLSEIIVRGG